MAAIYSRRRLLVAASGAVLGGCVSGSDGTGSDGDDSSATESSNGQDQTANTPTVTPTDHDAGDTPGDKKTPTDGSTSTPDWDEDELRETGTLDSQLVDLLTAEDRGAVATDHGIGYRPEDGMVRVTIELEVDGEFPEGYRTDGIDRYQQRVIGYVHVDDLASLATDDDVRIIRPYEEPKVSDGSLR
jgi:hypothetical protein